jgi:hypothetical protein
VALDSANAYISSLNGASAALVASPVSRELLGDNPVVEIGEVSVPSRKGSEYARAA